MSTLRLPEHGLRSPVFRTTGLIVFDPERGTMKNRIKNWVVINLDHGIADYYRWMFRKNWFRIDPCGRRRPIYQPSWGAHISVVRGERSHRLAHAEQDRRWSEAHRLYHGRRVSVSYSNWIRQTGDSTGGDRPDHFWFIDAHCEYVQAIRLDLNLPTRDTASGKPYTSHITIGRTY